VFAGNLVMNDFYCSTVTVLQNIKHKKPLDHHTPNHHEAGSILSNALPFVTSPTFSLPFPDISHNTAFQQFQNVLEQFEKRRMAIEMHNINFLSSELNSIHNIPDYTR
jgi:hypothetical protein